MSERGVLSCWARKSSRTPLPSYCSSLPLSARSLRTRRAATLGPPPFVRLPPCVGRPQRSLFIATTVTQHSKRSTVDVALGSPHHSTPSPPLHEEGSPSAVALTPPRPSFLDLLLHPEETIPLVDSVRTYRTMDLQNPACPVFDPKASLFSASAIGNTRQDEISPGPVKRAYDAGKLWNLYRKDSASSTSNEKRECSSVSPPRDNNDAAPAPAPEWFRQLCWDLYHRTDSSEDPMKKRETEGSRTTTSNELAKNPSFARSTAETEDEMPDPFLFLPFELLDESQYQIGPYVFPSTSTYSPELRRQLTLGEPQREYVCFAFAYPFPERHQLPTTLGTVPSRLYIDPNPPPSVLSNTTRSTECDPSANTEIQAPVPLVLLQLDPHHPPALWLPLKPTSAAVRRALSNFAEQAARHRDQHHARWAARYADAKRFLSIQKPRPTPLDPSKPLLDREHSDTLRMLGALSRQVLYHEALPVRAEHPNEQNFFLGEFDNPEEEILAHMDLCTWLFAVPEMRCVVNLESPHVIPTIEGPGVAVSLYRCRFSKAVIQIMVQLSAEVKLPPLDPESMEFLWKDSQAVPKMKIPVFARVLWPDHTHLAGGGALIARWNALLETEFALDMPVDALMAVFETMQWCRPHLPPCERHMGVLAMRERVRDVLAAWQTPAMHGSKPLLYPSTAEIPNPEYTLAERVGMYLQYWSHLDDPAEVRRVVEGLLPAANAPIRMGCAKAALIMGDRELFRYIVQSEPPGRMQVYMTKMVKKRKTRDLTEAVPRLQEGQFEFAAPLWTKRHTRIDANTLEGRADLARRRK